MQDNREEETTERIRLPLDPSVPQSQVESLAYVANWDVHRIQKRTEDTPFEVTWIDPEAGTLVHYIRDFLLEVEYLVVEGPRAEAVARMLETRLKVVSLDDALRMARDGATREDRIGGMYYAVLASRGAEPPAVDLVTEALEDADVDVRRAAIFAAGYAEWSELDPALARVAREDVDPEIRSDAAAMIEGLEKAREGGSA